MKNLAILMLLVVLDAMATFLFPVVLLATYGFEMFGVLDVFLGTRDIHDVLRAHAEYATATTLIAVAGCLLHVFVLHLATRTEELEYLPLWSRPLLCWLNCSHRRGG